MTILLAIKFFILSFQSVVWSDGAKSEVVEYLWLNVALLAAGGFGICVAYLI